MTKMNKKHYKPKRKNNVTTCNKINDFHNEIEEAKKNKIGSCGLDAKLENSVRVGHRAIQIKSRVLRKNK